MFKNISDFFKHLWNYSRCSECI